MRTTDLLPAWFRNWMYSKNLRSGVARNLVRRETVPLEQARTVALLFEATRPENIVRINSFAEKLGQSGVKVEMLGFVNRKMAGQDVLHFSWFSLQDLNWYGAPKMNASEASAQNVREFTEKRFDILINAWLDDSKPLNWVASLSRARFRISPYMEQAEKAYCPAEFMISLSPDNCNLDYYFAQLEHYLNLLHTNAQSPFIKSQHA